MKKVTWETQRYKAFLFTLGQARKELNRKEGKLMFWGRIYMQEETWTWLVSPLLRPRSQPSSKGLWGKR